MCDTAGEYRQGPIEITNSSHKPPDHSKVPALVKQCMAYLTGNWDVKPPMHLAAYALWQLGWIHPFHGRQRAHGACGVHAMIICLKHGAWPPEKNIMPKKNIRGARARYYFRRVA